MILVHKVFHLGDAERAIAEHGLTFDRTITVPIPYRSYYGGEQRCHPGVHTYFMQGQCDIGYWTPLMSILVIHDKPRQWSDESLQT